MNEKGLSSFLFRLIFLLGFGRCIVQAHGILLFYTLMGYFESANLLAALYKQSYPSDPFSLCFCIGYIPFL
ncbi:hypothetical protein LEP1GSC068_1439 [Leptospira sp. Fiocruz LV3954]|nr:hypothetical protein LEP1GSC068_1439 [Leptospira sp. Fiocruz LV3954]EMI63827.1 hypothetical protein LEP1GSC076_3051 [Leptospira sp. Fiocruz LV4135]